MNNEMLKSMTNGCYQLQKLRIQHGNRVVANFRAKLGIKAGQKTETVEGDDEKKILKIVTLAYEKITEGVVKVSKRAKFNYDGTISSYAELILVDGYMKLLQNEQDQFGQLKNIVSEFPIWKHFLKDVRGCGPAIAAVIISEFDIHKAKYASSLHKYAGLDVVLVQTENGETVGEGRSRKKAHLEDAEYTDRHGEKKVKKGITFNPFLKTKLAGVLGGSFLKSKSEYSEVYYNYKHRISNDPRHKEKTKIHLHNMANRYMLKVFLNDLYAKWREIEGLEVYPPYHEAKLGMKHTGS